MGAVSYYRNELPRDNFELLDVEANNGQLQVIHRLNENSEVTMHDAVVDVFAVFIDTFDQYDDIHSLKLSQYDEAKEALWIYLCDEERAREPARVKEAVDEWYRSESDDESEVEDELATYQKGLKAFFESRVGPDHAAILKR